MERIQCTIHFHRLYNNVHLFTTIIVSFFFYSSNVRNVVAAHIYSNFPEFYCHRFSVRKLRKCFPLHPFVARSKNPPSMQIPVQIDLAALILPSSSCKNNSLESNCMHSATIWNYLSATHKYKRTHTHIHAINKSHTSHTELNSNFLPFLIEAVF